MRIAPTVGLLLALVSSAGVLNAQEGKAPATTPIVESDAAAAVDPAAKGFIDKFRGNMKNVKDLSCTSSQKM